MSVFEISEELKELIPGFLERKQNEINEAKKAFKAQDYESLKKIAHEIKGSSGGYGFDLMGQMGANLEQAAKSQNNGEISKQIHDIEALLQNIEIKWVA